MNKPVPTLERYSQMPVTFGLSILFLQFPLACLFDCYSGYDEKIVFKEHIRLFKASSGEDTPGVLCVLRILLVATQSHTSAFVPYVYLDVKFVNCLSQIGRSSKSRISMNLDTKTSCIWQSCVGLLSSRAACVGFLTLFMHFQHALWPLCDVSGYDEERCM